MRRTAFTVFATLAPTSAMAADSNALELILGVAVMIAVGVVAMVLNGRSTVAAADPSDASAATTDNLAEKTMIQGGPWQIVFRRQSGGVYRTDTAETAEEAVRKVQASFRRAGIDVIRLSHNGLDGFSAMRIDYSGRGRSEGKKLAGASVERA